jgi:tetratricopeptide (TPR) repeat protein
MPDTIERFTEFSKEALCLAEQAAVEMNHKTISVEHLLVGMTESAGVAGKILRGLGLGSEPIKEWFEKSYVDAPNDPNANIELTTSVKRILEAAVDEARRMLHSQICSGHLLLAMLRLNPPIMGKALQHLEMSTSDLRALTKMTIDDYGNPKDIAQTSYTRTTSNRNKLNESSWWNRFTSKLLTKTGVEPLANLEHTTPPIEGTRLIHYLMQQIGRDQPQSRFHNFIGNIYLDQQDYGAAEQAFNDAIVLQPELGFVYCNRGLARLKQKNYDGAIADFTKMIEHGDYQYLGYINRGWAYLGKRDIDLALADFDEAIRLNAPHEWANNGRANALLSNKELDRAIDECNQILERDAKNVSAHDTRGTARAHNGDLDGAEADFNEVFRQCPVNSRSHSNLGWLALLRKDYEKTLEFCNEAIRLDAKNGPAYYSRGSAKAANEDIEGAVADYRQSLDLWTNVDNKLCAPIAQEMRSYLAQWSQPLL